MPNNDESSQEVNWSAVNNIIVSNGRQVKTATSLDGLISWLGNHGAVINSVTERNVPGTSLTVHMADLGSGRGLFATTQIDEGSLIIRIPGECLLNLDTLGALHLRFPEFDSVICT